MKSSNLALIYSISILLLFSCSVYKGDVDMNLDAPLPPKDSWETISMNIDSNLVIPIKWWALFNDSLLDSTIEIFINNNYDLKLAASSLKTSQAISKINGSDIFPRINLSLLDGNALGIGSSIPSEMYGLNLSSSWEIDIWGKLLSKRFSAQYIYKADLNEYNFLRLSIISQGIKLYYDVIESKEQQELAKSSVKTMEKIFDIVEKRYSQGVRSSLDYRLALSNLLSAKAMLEQKNIILDNITRQFEIMIGLYPSGDFKTRKLLPTSIVIPIPPNLPSTIIANRPDIKAALKRLKSYKYEINYTNKSFLPSINLTDNSGVLSMNFEGLLDGDYSLWNLGKTIALPIFQAGRIKANKELVKSIYEQSEIEYVYTILKAFSEIESKLSSDKILLKQLNSLKEAYIQSQEAYTLAYERYKNGLSNLLTVLDSQKRMFDTKAQMISVQKKLIQNRIDLFICLGGSYGEF